ncbi:hypothetical protein KUTeg_022665 [Tegillarca granosa]|uniref:Transglutaminase N-terminal domain-containing protein n=1 Tax=Tegillarca granosa TaxID=220873 RepID=A0ABQ9E508_TEGGR|nr:hypothetical protein KUTeg_022665 [Tegillarca granosa]
MDDRNKDLMNQQHSEQIISEKIDEYATPQEDLKIIVLDLLPVENGFDHHTIKFDAVRNGSLVVRRGQTFDLLVKFNREFVMQKDSLRFTFETGNEPSPVRGSYIECLLGNKENQSRWRVMIKKRIAEDEIVLFAYTPPDCLVSNWKLTVETVELTDEFVNPISRSKEIHLFILFNPWCQDDSVYFPDNKLLEEYVNNDSGVIFQGNYKQIGAKPWFFGQFEEGILEASLYCMQKGFNFKV